MPKIDERVRGEKTCIACEGSGKSSKGEPCRPCRGTGKRAPMAEKINGDRGLPKREGGG